MVRMVDLIAKKRDGKELTTEEIQAVIEGYTNGDIPDYQMSAWAMSVYFQGMTEKEMADLTMAMVKSGEQVNLEAIEGVKVDKHSTGGVGDTTTLVVAPLVATLGIAVAKMSGRGLGYTGGTVDKLASIPGFHVELSKDEFIKKVNENNLAVVGQTENLAPADKMLYALRDVTATVESIPLIASSIMSKKIAAGCDAIVLDVKTGAGAFMKTLEEAKLLAQAMVKIGNQVGCKTMAIISDMSQPLGYAVGNALEIKEAIATLRGQGPRDLEQLCLTLGKHMVMLAGKASSFEDAEHRLREVMYNGQALTKFKQFIDSQGGDTTIVDDPEKLPQATFQIEVPAQQTGIVTNIVADEIGKAAMLLGAGRSTKKSEIDFAVGVILHKKVGDAIQAGQSLMTIHANRRDVADIIAHIQANVFIGTDAKVPELIQAIITA